MVAPLLTSHDATDHVHLIVGSGSLANARCSRSLEVGAKPILVGNGDGQLHHTLRQKLEDGRMQWLKRNFQEDDLKTLGRAEIDGFVDAVFLTTKAKDASNEHISTLCKRLRIPINTVDSKELSSFTLLSTHSDGPLQIGITTSGNGCKLASRVRREIAAALPHHLGSAITRLGTVRQRILQEDHKDNSHAEPADEDLDDDSVAQRATFNQLVNESDYATAKTRRIRWLSQICEYWPLSKLASIGDEDIDRLLQSYRIYATSHTEINGDELNILPSKPRVILAGSGPGSPSLLTVATRDAIQMASVVLADKLVPAPVLDLVPRRTELHIARKFPGNADAAQQELLEMGLKALNEGKTVLRLKQGDPYIYGRGGEEYAFFKDHGFDPIVLPGITSALSAPLFAAIPSTHRSVSDQVLICTGTGRKGVAPTPPAYIKTQTIVFLMALHRLSSLVDSLIYSGNASSDSATDPNPSPWPATTPCAVVERASCSDQRVVRTTLEHVTAAVEEVGSRPPGLLVLGHACEVLKGSAEQKWMVEEGFIPLESLLDTPPQPLHDPLDTSAPQA